MSPHNLEPLNSNPSILSVTSSPSGFIPTHVPRNRTWLGSKRTPNPCRPGSVQAATGHLPPMPHGRRGEQGPGRGSARQSRRGPLPEIGRPLGNPSPVSKALPGPARPPMALTVQRKAMMCRPARSVPPVHPQHLAALLQPSRGFPHGCGRRMAGRAAARARLGIRGAAQPLPFRPAAPPPAAKMAAGRGPNSNHFRFRYKCRSRWRECCPAENRAGGSAPCCTGALPSPGSESDSTLLLRMLPTPDRGLTTPRGDRKPMAGSVTVAREPLATRWRSLEIRALLRSSRAGTRRDCRHEMVRAVYPRWSSVTL